MFSLAGGAGQSDPGQGRGLPLRRKRRESLRRERQRIAIARALLRGSTVLLADEATAALDAETAKTVTDSILSLEGLTRVVVTHRLEPSALSRYDGIIVMKNGRVCEQGSFDGLMEAKNQFYALFMLANG